MNKTDPAIIRNLPQLDNDITLKDLFSIEELQHLQDLFSEAYGVSSAITYPDGTPVTTATNFCRLCKEVVRGTEKGRAYCHRTETSFGESGSRIKPCLGGNLWEAGANIMVGNKHLGNWLIGQTRSEHLNVDYLKDFANEIGIKKEELIKALEEVPVMSSEKFEKVSQMLFTFANELSERAYKNLELRRQSAEREKTFAQLRESEEYLSVTLKSIGDGVITTDARGMIISLNKVAEDLCGWTTEEAAGKPLEYIFRILNSQTRSAVDNPVKNVIQSGKISELENHTVLVSKNGKEYHITDSAAPIKNDDGKILGMVLVFSDVTEKYFAREKIRKSEERFHSLFENMIEGVSFHEFVCDDEGNPIDYRIMSVNKAFEQQSGLFIPEVIGKTSLEVFKTEYPPFFETYLNVVRLGEPVSFEGYFEPLDRFLSISAYKTGENGFATIFADITTAKKAEGELKENEARWRRAIVGAPIPIMIFDEDGNVVQISSGWTRYSGYNSEEIPTTADWTKKAYGEIKTINKARLDQLFESFQTVKDGEKTVIAKDGSKRIWDFQTTPLGRSSKGRRVLLSLAVDITNQKNAEEKINRQNERLQKSNAEKDKFFSIIAHDLKSPFNAILGFSELLVELMGEKEIDRQEAVQFARIISNSSNKVVDLLTNLMEWSRSQTGRLVSHLVQFSLKKLTDEIVLLFSESLKQKSITLKVSDIENITIFSDKDMISTIIRNLISNSIKFTSEGGEITISAISEHDKITISVQDTGVGIPETIREKLFTIGENYSTPGTQNEEGTGLGLIICKEFIDKLGGDIWVESESGQGSKFSFTVPVYQSIP